MPQFYTCQVTEAGPGDAGKVFVRLTETNGAFNTRWFNAVDAQKKEILATALTAMATGFPVDAYLVSAVEYSELQRLYVKAAHT